MSFNDLGLSPKVLSAVEAAGYTQPTPIQTEAIPHVLARRDVLGIAQTGTGKTAAFTLPMLTLLESGRARARMPRTLILEPTRELAAQVVENFDRYGVNHKLNVALIIGGVSFGDQDAKIMRGVDVLIATPGRLLDHVERGKLLLSGIELLVIDEADRMLDMGFIPDIERIVKLVPFTRQTLFFSATMPPEITRLADQFLSNPHRVEVARPASTADTITQAVVTAAGKDEAKREVLRRLVREADGLTNAIVFCNRKREVALLHKSLERHGFSAVALHGDMDQPSRTRALDGFRAGQVTLLIASDVAARGLDIPAVSHVFNFDVPHHPEDYVHRIGRTGRAGRAGAAFTIAAPGDEKSLAAIEKLIGKPIPRADSPERDVAEAASETDEAPRKRRSRGGRKAADEATSGAVTADAEPIVVIEDDAAPREGRRRRSEGRARQGAAPEGAGETPREGGRRRSGRQKPEPLAASPEPIAVQPRREQPRRAETTPPESRAQREPARERDRAPRRSERARDDDGPAVQGLGEHVPSFLLRPSRGAPAKVN